MNKKIWIGAIVVIVMILIGWFIFQLNGRSQPAAEDTQYDFSTVQRMDLSAKVDATGNVISSTSTDILPEFEATVKQIYCKAGDYVKQGQLLVLMTSPAMSEALANAAANVSQDQPNLAQAQRDYEDTKELLDVQGATLCQVSDALDKVNVCAEQLRSAQTILNDILHKPDNANFIAPNHHDLLIKAPFDGVIAWINVVSGADVPATTAIISIGAIDALIVEAQVDDSEIQTVKPGQKVVVTTDDPDQPALQGVVNEVGTIGTTTAGVVDFPVKIRVTDRNGILKNGMAVDTTIIIEDHPNTLAVPVNAVVSRRGKNMVAVKTKDGINFVRVETGIKVDTNIEILSGLNAGETIAIARPKLITKPNTNTQNGLHFGGFGR